ncbi:MAG: metal-dependent hydrolase [Nitrososphaerota archaeon]|jgi:L-ascorbate metabolism protein UlaG (beta-lactamase superfamily)|nr:metal-dependent hydrolase [Nitrososphaerota archaeon]MDG6926873.1 metal-dependent hydrolase [Nitrososphaerota archaeon]MDG6930009.1 metal-dependent hydrolase [Nitrososphaerota archaeon]MDG6931960.1 metal-dependent hydrolase [Nitrososphaerota archaeon]MDG6943837.1 metal-dependent hydrolase [Nitrososphaerota archaeon]
MLKWLGHSAFELNTSNKMLLIDPWISNPNSPAKVKDYYNADYLIVTHDHSDHLGDAVEISRNSGAPIIAVFELANFLNESEKVKTIGMNIGGPLKLTSSLSVFLTQAFHSSTHGAPTGTIVKTDTATIYHAGDTGLFGDMKLIGQVYKPDIMLIPIGGFFTMNPEQAAIAVQMVSPKIAIPMHYDTFEAIKQDPLEFARIAKGLSPGTEVVVLKPGESIELR